MTDTENDSRLVLAEPEKRRARIIGYILTFMATFSLGTSEIFAPWYAGILGASTFEMGWAMGSFGLVYMVSPILGGKVSDRIGRKAPLALCLVTTAGVTLMIPFSTDLLTLSIILGIYGAVIGLSGPSMAYVTDVSPKDKLEISMGLYRMISDFGFVVGPLLLGFLADITATPVEGASHSGLIGFIPFSVASIILIVAFFFLLRADDPVKDRNHNRAM